MANVTKVGMVGMVGCGNISGTYLNMFRKLENVEIAACADLVREKAEAQAQEFGVPTVCTTEELLADPEIEIILNLTIPRVHTEADRAAIAAGKHVYSEKPLCVDRHDGRRVLDVAAESGLRVGCAPDTFLGGGGQTCREIIDRGDIGAPVAAVAFFTSGGHEAWHPDPEFFYKPGGGPMFDMGPYYLTALVNLLGPVRRVTGSASISFPERTITSKPASNNLRRKHGSLRLRHFGTPLRYAGCSESDCRISYSIQPLVETTVRFPVKIHHAGSANAQARDPLLTKQPLRQVKVVLHELARDRLCVAEVAHV